MMHNEFTAIIGITASNSSSFRSRPAGPTPGSIRVRPASAATITVTRNEILYSLNKADDFILAIVEFLDGDTLRAHYLRRPFQREPDFGATSVNYDYAELLRRAEVVGIPRGGAVGADK